MDHVRSMMLEDESPISSMKQNSEFGIVSIGDELGNIHLLSAQNTITKICIEKDVCLVDHCWISESQIAYTCGKDIKVFDFVQEKTLQQFIGHEKKLTQQPVLNVKESQVGSVFMSSGDDNCVFVWDIRNYRPCNFFLAHSRPATSIDFSSDSSLILTASDEGYWQEIYWTKQDHVQLSTYTLSRTWDSHDGMCQNTSFIRDNPPLSCAKFTKNHEVALISSLDGKSTLLDLKRSKSLKEYSGYQNEDYLLDVELIADQYSQKLAGFCIGSENGLLHYFDFKRSLPRYSLQVEADNNTLDLLVQSSGKIYTAGRTLGFIHIIDLKPDSIPC